MLENLFCGITTRRRCDHTNETERHVVREISTPHRSATNPVASSFLIPTLIQNSPGKIACRHVPHHDRSPPPPLTIHLIREMSPPPGSRSSVPPSPSGRRGRALLARTYQPPASSPFASFLPFSRLSGRIDHPRAPFFSRSAAERSTVAACVLFVCLLVRAARPLRRRRRRQRRRRRRRRRRREARWHFRRGPSVAAARKLPRGESFRRPRRFPFRRPKP